MEHIIQTDKSFLKKINLSELRECEMNQILLDNCVDDIKDKLELKPPIIVWNKTVNQQRDVGFFSNKSIGYHYSNQLSPSKPLTLNLELLLEHVNKMFNSNFNGILINRYTDGLNYIGPHSDDEKNLDASGVIAISYGGERIFRIRDKKTKQIFKDIQIKNLDIIHMGGDFQKEFTHEIPQTKKFTEPRYSFTFRHHKI